MKFHILPQLAAALMAIDAGAGFLLDPVFSSGMVLQQRKPIAFSEPPIRGRRSG